MIILDCVCINNRVITYIAKIIPIISYRPVYSFLVINIIMEIIICSRYNTNQFRCNCVEDFTVFKENRVSIISFINTIRE